MSFTNRTAKGLLDSLFGKTSVFGALATAPVVHVALSTTTPAEDGTNVTEPVGNGYARVATAAGDWNTATDADPSLIDNATAVTFPQATASWGTVTHFVLFDALTSGNVLASGALDTARTPSDTTDPAEFAIGDLNLTLD